MAEKSKTYDGMKFSYEIIQKACKELAKHLNATARKSIHFTWEITKPEAKWKLDTENQFAMEYVKDEILGANIFEYSNSQIIFYLNYQNSSYGKPTTTISINLPKIENIDKVFDIFETNYAQFASNINNTTLENPQFNAQYSFEKTLPSTFVEKKLLVDLERYILQRAKQLDTRKKNLPDYSVTVLDSSGTLSLKSIEVYPREIFDNEIESITLSYGGLYESIKIYLRFAKDKNKSEIEISYKGENAREVVESIKVGIFQSLKDSKTWNHIYHPHFAVQMLLVYGFLGTAVLAVYLIYKQSVWLQPSIALSLLFLVFLVAPNFKPYTTFDTRRNNAIQKWSGWFIESLLGILLIWLIAKLFPVLIP